MQQEKYQPYKKFNCCRLKKVEKKSDFADINILFTRLVYFTVWANKSHPPYQVNKISSLAAVRPHLITETVISLSHYPQKKIKPTSSSNLVYYCLPKCKHLFTQ
jgi:hypothetical protein